MMKLLKVLLVSYHGHYFFKVLLNDEVVKGFVRQQCGLDFRGFGAG